MDARKLHQWVPDEILEKLFGCIESPRDRSSLSEVCKQWYLIEGRTRKVLVVCFGYAVNPALVTLRFPNIQSLKIKGEPRIAEFGILGDRWGGYAAPWVEELVSYRSRGSCLRLKSLHLLRMKVTDVDLTLLAEGFNASLEVLRVGKCIGFSTIGLCCVARCCRNLRVLDFEETSIDQRTGDWLSEIAEHNNQLEVLNFFLTGLEVPDMKDVLKIVTRCKSLRCLKLPEICSVDMSGVLGASCSLQQLAILYGANDHTMNNQLELPKTLTSFTGDIPLPLDRLVAARLVELDLMSTSTTLDAEAHVEVIRCCPNLETLKVRNIIGDVGLEAVAACCKKLRNIRVENLEDQHGLVSHLGLVSLATNCIHIESVAIYLSDIANCALEAFGAHCPDLCDFRIVLLNSSSDVTELPLDRGVGALFRGCRKLKRAAIYLRSGGLTDAGLEHIGRLGNRLHWLLLGSVGSSDAGFAHLASGCSSLAKLELRECPFSERAIAEGVKRMNKLRFLWVQGINGDNVMSFLEMGDWRVEYMPNEGHFSQVVPLSQLRDLLFQST